MQPHERARKRPTPSASGCSRTVPASGRGSDGGPISVERQWGTVREDYSRTAPPGTISRTTTPAAAPIAGARTASPAISDDRQRLCLALALWNGQDPILKERLFGLTNSEGNHGEDVKELYYYLDATPTHSYLKYLYKYPQRAYPYAWLVDENRRRSRHEPEFELLDTGVFDDDRYFDVFVEYAKAAPDDLLMRITVHNRGPEPATIHLLPQLWFRNTWSWDGEPKPEIGLAGGGVLARHHAARRLPPACRGRARAPVHRERDQRGAPVRRRRMPPARSRTRSTPI